MQLVPLLTIVSACSSSRLLHCPRKGTTTATTHLRGRRRDDVVNSYEMGEGGSGSGDDIMPTIRAPARCSSRRAALIVRKSTPDDGLLIITCDASGRGGGSKHDGIAAVLRLRHGAPVSPQTETSKWGKEDLIDVVARRTVHSRTSSEVAAIALGMKRALQVVPPSRRRSVLILSDSEFALDFYCVGNTPEFGNITNDGSGGRQQKRRQRTRTTTERLREDAHRRCLLSLTSETPIGVLFARVRSSSRGVEIAGVDYVDAANDDAGESGVGLSPRDGIGFIDHDAADYLSSIARSFANANNGEGGVIGALLNSVVSLGQKDMAWLEMSDIVTERSISGVRDLNNDSGSLQDHLRSDFSWQSIEVVGSEMRYIRRERNQRRINIIRRMLCL